MAANAPYYQRRPGQSVSTSNTTNASPSQFILEEDEYDLPTTVAVSPHDQQRSSTYSEHTTCEEARFDTMDENHNLVELLEAAATAAGQATQTSNTDHKIVVSSAESSKRQKRLYSPTNDDAEPASRPADTSMEKRRRVEVLTDPRLQPNGHNDQAGSGDCGALPSTESHMHDVRATGVHSAVALFRSSYERTPRKSTRPPMSKLFISLQLSPENFLQLQAQAKAYMLDTKHPERQNCVGNRGKGDTDMVKLRLFNCVREFLDTGIGERYFGEHVEKPGDREVSETARALGEETGLVTKDRLTWPQDGNKIIGLVTPLMRRMVTNERQRMYAIETRKGGGRKTDKESSTEAAMPQDRSAIHLKTLGQPTEDQPCTFDPTLRQAQDLPHLTPSTSGQTSRDRARTDQMIIEDTAIDESVAEKSKNASTLR